MLLLFLCEIQREHKVFLCKLVYWCNIYFLDFLRINLSIKTRHLLDMNSTRETLKSTFYKHWRFPLKMCVYMYCKLARCL